MTKTANGEFGRDEDPETRRIIDGIIDAADRTLRVMAAVPLIGHKAVIDEVTKYPTPPETINLN